MKAISKWSLIRTCLPKRGLWSLETKWCSTSRGMPDCIPCGHTLGTVLVSINIMEFGVFYFIAGIWKVSVIPPKIPAFLNWKKERKKRYSTLYWTANKSVLIKKIKKKSVLWCKTSFHLFFLPARNIDLRYSGLLHGMKGTNPRKKLNQFRTLKVLTALL